MPWPLLNLQSGSGAFRGDYSLSADGSVSEPYKYLLLRSWSSALLAQGVCRFPFFNNRLGRLRLAG